MKERKAVMVAKIITHIALIRTSLSSVIDKYFSVLKILKVCLLVLRYKSQLCYKAVQEFSGKTTKGISQTLLWGISLCIVCPLQQQIFIRYFHGQRSSHKAPKTSPIPAEASTSSTAIPLSPHFTEHFLWRSKYLMTLSQVIRKQVAFSKLVSEKCVSACEYTHLLIQTRSSNQMGHLQSC